MYEEYLGKTLSEIIIAKQALNNYIVWGILLEQMLLYRYLMR
jgi:hypothetical protein